MAWTPFGDVDLIRGVNVANIFKQAGASATGKTTDYDIIPKYTISGRPGQQQINGRISDQANAKRSVIPTNQVKVAPQLEITEQNGDSVDGSGLAGVGSAAGGGLSAKDLAMRDQLRGEITGKGGEIEQLYNALFGNLDGLLKARDSELETQYGEQQKKAADQYAAAIPEIENSYAAIGSGDSTDNSDAKDKAKFGHDETQKQIGKNKEADKAKLGAYGNEQRAKIAADKEAASRNVARAGETDDLDALRTMRNDLETNLSNGHVTQATLGTDGQARKDLSSLTSDNGRYDQAVTALDSIIKGSMSGAVKEAAVKAITDNAGLSDEEKKRVNQQYGNVYAEQAAL